MAVSTFEDAAQIVEYYKLRWRIESYFKVLKSGCTVEKCRLAEGDRLKKYLALFSVIAWRIYWLTFLTRLDPESSCEQALSENEWKTLFSVKNKTSILPRSPPNLATALRWIAGLGGFLNRKNDGDPGPLSIWKGWTRLQDMALAREIALW